MEDREMRKLTIVLAVITLIVMSSQAWAQWSTPVPVTEINTQYDEWTPYISSDGKSIYYGRLYTDTHAYSHIYQATREGTTGLFTSPTDVFSIAGHVISPWVSSDNLRMYYHNELSNGWFLKVSERASVTAPWSQGTTLSELSVVGTKLTEVELTSDELNIFFQSRHTSGGQGGHDIWMATRPDRNSAFGNIINLSEINSSLNEHLGSVSPDGLELYFSSDRNGISQIFKANRASLSDPFSNIEHLSVFDETGSTVVSPCISSDGSALYFSKFVAGAPADIYVSYNVPEPATLGLLGLSALMLRRKRS